MSITAHGQNNSNTETLGPSIRVYHFGADGLTEGVNNTLPNESETAGIDLYNVADISRNPVFKLFAKKVFLPGGLQINESSANDDYMTITWGIKF